MACQGNQRILALERMPGIFKDRRTRRSFQHRAGSRRRYGGTPFSLEFYCVETRRIQFCDANLLKRRIAVILPPLHNSWDLLDGGTPQSRVGTRYGANS